jgi:hypothetical protein
MTHETEADDGGHGHGHNHGSHDHAVQLRWRARVAHVFSESLGGHAHSATDQVDAELEATREGKRALVVLTRHVGRDRATTRSDGS